MKKLIIFLFVLISFSASAEIIRDTVPTIKAGLSASAVSSINLADNTIPVNIPIASIRLLTTSTMPGTKRLRSTDIGKEGDWVYDATDHTSTDDGATVLVDASGRRWKRVIGATVRLSWFGVVPTSTANQSSGIQAAINISKGKTLTGDIGVYYAKNLTTVDSMIFDGAGLTLKTDPSATYTTNDFLIKISHNNGVTFRNINFDGNKDNVPSLNVLAGVTLVLMSVDTATTFDNVTCFNSNFLGIHPVNCYNTKITKSNFKNTDTGILTQGGNNILIVSDCYFDGGTSEGICMYGSYNGLITGSITAQNTNPTSGTATTGSILSGGTLTDGNGITDYAITVSGTYTGQLTFQYSLDGGSSWITDSAATNYGQAAQTIIPASGATGTWDVDFYGFPKTTKFRVSANTAFTGTASLQMEALLGDRNFTISNCHFRNKLTSAALNFQYVKTVTVSNPEIDSCAAGMIFQQFQNLCTNVSVVGGSITNTTKDGISGPIVNSTFTGTIIKNAGGYGIWSGLTNGTANTTGATGIKSYSYNSTFTNVKITNASSVLSSRDGFRVENSINCQLIGVTAIDDRSTTKMVNGITIVGPVSNNNKITHCNAKNIVISGATQNTILENNDAQIFDNTSATGTIVKPGYNMGSTAKTITTDGNISLNLRGDVYTLNIGSAQVVDSIYTTPYFGRTLTFFFTNSNITFNSTGNIRISGGTFTGSTTTTLSLVYDGTNWIQSGGGGGATVLGANPSQNVGISVVNGSATTFMRSDAAPAISQAIVPTWTGVHTFANKLTLTVGQGTYTPSTTAGPGFTLNSSTLNDATSSGTVATNPINFIARTTLTATNATTYTNAATLWIDGAPSPSTNVTFSNAYGLYVNTGVSGFFGGITSGAPGFTGSNLVVAGGAGVSASGFGSLQYEGSTSSAYRASINGATTAALGAGAAYGGFQVGQQPITTAATGTHPFIANAVIHKLGSVTSSGATVTNSATLYVEATNLGLATNNYSLYVGAGAKSFLGGALYFSGITSSSAGNQLVIGSDSALHQGGNVYESVVVSAATTLTFSAGTRNYVFSGTAASTWTVPSIAGNTGIRQVIKNRGTVNLVIATAGSDNFYSNGLVTTYTVTPGSAIVILNDGTYWDIE
jgi:hypothetical protein